MAVKGIIFDKDGTLFSYAEVWGSVIKDYTDSILMTFNVKNADEARQRIYEIVGIDDRGNNYSDGFLFNHDKVIRIFFKLLAFCIWNGISPVAMYNQLNRFINQRNPKVLVKLRSMDFSGVQELMKMLCDRGIVIGIVTNDISSNTRAFLEIMGIDKYVRFLRTKESNCKRKPSVDSIKQFSSIYGLRRDEIAVVGDSIVDMEYAKAGSVGYTIAVMTGYGKREVLERYADVVYDTVAQLIDDPVLFAPEVK